MKRLFRVLIFALASCLNMGLAGGLALASDGENSEVAVRSYVAVAGDNFPMLAARIGAEADLLAAMNNMSVGAILPVGSVILLPVDGVESQVQTVATLASRSSYNIREMAITHWYSPVKGVITSLFTTNRDGSAHHGVDIAATTGTAIQAGQSGVVTEAGWCNSVYGYAVRIDHGNGWVTFYAHCSQVLCEAGDEVVAGEVIALVGSTGNSTGPHLHLELTKDGTFLDPLDFFLNVSDY